MYSALVPAVALVLAVLYLIIYPAVEYFRDPKRLRRYPAFKPLAGLTNLVFMREAALGFRSKTLYEKHKKHPVLRIGPNSLSYGTVDAIKDIYGHGSKCLKGEFYETLSGTHFHLADVVDKAEHARKRKVLSAAYALKNLESWEYKVSDKAERFIRGADKACTKPLKVGLRPESEDLTFDYRAWTNFFTLDAIADIGLSERLGFLDQGHDLVRAERMDGSIHDVNFRACLHSTALAQSITVWSAEWYKFNQRLTSYLSPTFRKWWGLNKGWDGIVYHRATQRLKRYQAGEKLSDFFQALMEDKNGTPNGLDWGEIVAEVSIMMNAGSDTTAIAMNNVMYWLLKNPRCMAKLRGEIDSVLDVDEIVAPYDKIKHLPYLRACLDESLRIVPPTTFGLPRRTPPEGAYILGDFIPGDTTVSISAYIVHRDPKIFPDPESYIPERWLGDKGKDLQPYFVSFSAGARGCIGRNISYLEQTVLLASVLHRYEFALPYPEWEPERREAMNCMPNAMPLKLWRREIKSGE
ncbi:Benzoate 4-monooxygenase [Colletotrichum siamense]|uniref:Benzoate 4-monooxygenase n=1 Tax=Colletotrichum siamense TaxID=690259 RepID=UPI001872A8E7|nr:Benzoate 4-monooxygenase [Colletotrichum siamense]KAF5506241.1 Benzoate 4-monooxygenase [Colletotrichum siamense]